MKRLFTFLLILFFTYIGNSQVVNGNFESWTSGSPDNWTMGTGITVAQETTTIHGGSSSASVNVTTATQANTDFRNSTLNVVSGTEYAFSCFVYHTEGHVKARWYIDGIYGTYSSGDATSNWEEMTYSYTPTTTGSIVVGLRFYDQAGFDGAEIVYVDDFTASAVTLPILVNNYNINFLDNKSLITWQTAFETNNSHFNIEWSGDGKEFTEIGKVEGHGTTRDIQNYSFIHKSPVAGNNYYRLTQVDFDGNKQSFPVKSIYFDTKSRNFNILPTVIADNMKIEFNSPVENGRMLIFDINGQLVKSFILAEGIDVFRADISDLIPGQYIAKYIDNQETSSKKFIKQ